MIEKYLDFMKHKGYSPNTLTGTRKRLSYYSAFLREVLDKKALHATEDDIEKYVLRIKQTLKPGTIRLRLSRIRGLYRFLHKEGFILKNPTLNLLVLKKENLPKDVPDESVIRYLLNQPDEHTYHGIRDRAILELMYSSGLRNKEVRDLKVGDIDLKEHTVKITCGKGQKGRTVPLGKKAAESIQKYLEITRPKYQRTKSQDYLFLSERGNPLPEGAINEMLLKYKAKSELTKKINPHALRHACALHMLRGGAPIEAVQEMLGHRQLTTTQIYTRLYPKDLKNVHKKFHPRERQKTIQIHAP